MPADREGRSTDDRPPEPRGDGAATPSSLATDRGATRRRVLLTTAGAGLASIAGVGRTGATQTTGGDVLWRFESRNTGASSPTVVDGTVYVTSSIDDDYRDIHALDAADGKEKWRWSHYSRSRHPGAPSVAYGTVFVPGSLGVYAVDRKTGEKQWKQWGTEEYGGERGLQSSPTVAEGSVFAGYGSSVDAYNAAVGKHRWSGTVGEILTAGSPVVVDGTAYVAGKGTSVAAYDAASGDERWRWDDAKTDVWAPTVADGTVFVTGGFPERVYALNAETGETRWTFTADRDIGSWPTVVGETLLMGGDRGIYAIDVVDGEERRWFDAGSWAPTVVGDTLFANDSDGYVYALNVADGRIRWRFETGGGQSTPIVVDGTLYVGTADGTVYALDAGVDGSSEDSRALLGTQGHHHAWANEASAGVAPDEFAVEIDAAPVPAIRGRTIAVRVTVENVGGQPGEREVRYSGDGAAGNFEETIALEGGESQTIPVSETFDEDYPWNDVTVTATVYEDEAELQIPVKNPPTMLDRIPGGKAFATVGVFGGATYLMKRLYD